MFLFIFEMLIARIYPHIERRIGSMIEESGHSTQHWHGMAQLEVKNLWCFYEDWIPADYKVRLIDLGGGRRYATDKLMI